MEPLLGQVQAFGFNFPPRGWTVCDGQLLSINQHQALFSLRGVQFGGDGRTTLALPDLRGRLAVHDGTGTGRSNIQIGERGNASLTLANLPVHHHSGTLQLGAGPGLEGSENGQHLASNSAGETTFSTVPPGTGRLVAGTLSLDAVGNHEPFDIGDPFLGINYSIALTDLSPAGPNSWLNHPLHTGHKCPEYSPPS